MPCPCACFCPAFTLYLHCHTACPTGPPAIQPLPIQRRRETQRPRTHLQPGTNPADNIKRCKHTPFQALPPAPSRTLSIAQHLRPRLGAQILAHDIVWYDHSIQNSLQPSPVSSMPCRLRTQAPVSKTGNFDCASVSQTRTSHITWEPTKNSQRQRQRVPAPPRH